MISTFQSATILQRSDHIVCRTVKLKSLWITDFNSDERSLPQTLNFSFHYATRNYDVASLLRYSDA